MPNRTAKENKRKRALLNKKWATEGRTAKQHKKWLTKQADKGNVVKVNFGQGGDAKGGTMRIRKDNPKARKSFRARHNCDTPGPRHKARYWSCRKW